MNDLTFGQKRALLQVRIRKDVEQYGCFVMSVFGDEDVPQFAYSIGIPTTFPKASEILLFGLPPHNMAGIINACVANMRKGAIYEAGKVYDDITTLPCFFGKVEPEQYDRYVGQAQIYHKSDHDFPLLQLVWSDTHGVLPWQEGFEEKFRKMQPLLFSKVKD